MRKIFFTFSMMAVVLLATSCFKSRESKEIVEVEKSADIGLFDQIRIIAPCSLSFEAGDTVIVKMNGDSKLVENIVFENEDGCLVIKEDHNLRFRNGDVHIMLVAPTLQALDLQGAGTVQLNGEVKADDMSINMEGAGTIKAEKIVCRSLSANVKGAGSISLKDVTSEDASLNMNGVGSLDAKFTDSGALNCSINGVGSVNLHGNVKSFKKQVNGVGHINADKLKVGE